MPASTFAALFGVSPFRGMQSHMRVVHKCALQLEPLLQAATEDDQDKIAEIAREIYALEEEADKLKHDIRVHLPRTLFLPVDRRDLLEVLHTQDAIADTVQDVAGLFIERRMTVPPYMKADLLALGAECVRVVTLAVQAIEQLDELLAMGFSGSQAEKVAKLLDEVNAAEDVTDDLGTSLARTLFAHEDELKPVSVLMWYQMIGWIGDVADQAEKVGNRLRLIIAR